MRKSMINDTQMPGSQGPGAAGRPRTRPPVILFDGVCNLCNSMVQWVIQRDTKARFNFASLRSEAARLELQEVMSTEEIQALPDSIVLVDSSGVHTQSTAVIRIARGLGFPFTLLGLGIVVPRPIRDAAYRWVARNRYRWFGRRDACMRPTPGVAARFLDAGEGRNPPPAVLLDQPPVSEISDGRTPG